MPKTNNPLITFCLLSYNHEAFISEAVQAAFSQTYSPLEIILSDDHSTDRSFDIITEMAKQYKGPNKLVLNRSERNLGLCQHLNLIAKKSKGELFVFAAGDDISLPNRVETCFEAWEDSNRRSMSISSEYILIDETGNEIGFSSPLGQGVVGSKFHHIQQTPWDFAGWRYRVVYGCSHACSREIFEVFGDLPNIPNLVNEDTTINFRSVLANGKTTFIDIPLVKYRRHSENCSPSFIKNGKRRSGKEEGLDERMVQFYKRSIAVAKCFLHDTNLANERTIITAKDNDRIKNEAIKSVNAFELRIRLTEKGYINKLPLLFALLRLGKKRVVLDYFKNLIK